MSIDSLVAWLVEGALDAPRPQEVVERVCRDLVASGVPVERGETFVRTLHPHVVGRSFVWRPGKPVEVLERTYEYLQSPEFNGCPVAETCRTGEYVRVRVGKDPDAVHATVRSLVPEGHTDFVVAPLRFRTGDVHAFTFATSVPGGFTEEHLASIRGVIPPLARVGEIIALSRIAANLLQTYVGGDAGERILSGDIRRGDLESIGAVIWCSDLRGFTAMTTELPPADVIRALNELFECQVAAIEKHGGEVLKFIGDGLLAIFRVDDDHGQEQQCEAALVAAGEAFDNLRSINERRVARGDSALRIGLALHPGFVAYGNIGSARRLDFTCIGPAVNQAARMEAVASRLGRDLVVSEEFRRGSSRSFELLGSFDLKGIATPQAVYGVAAGKARS